MELKLNVKSAIPGGPIMLFTKLTLQPMLAGHPLGPISKYEIRDRYYDTSESHMAKAGIGLRCRMENGLPFVTMKVSHFQAGALTQREEFEEPLTQERLNWVLSHSEAHIGAGPFPVSDFLAGRTCGTLVPVLEVGTARLMRSIGKVAKLVLDLVEYPGFSANPYYDIEVEAIGGKAGEQVLRQAERELITIAEGYLRPVAASKLERGLRLKNRPNV